MLSDSPVCMNCWNSICLISNLTHTIFMAVPLFYYLLHKVASPSHGRLWNVSFYSTLHSHTASIELKCCCFGPFDLDDDTRMSQHTVNVDPSTAFNLRSIICSKFWSYTRSPEQWVRSFRLPVDFDTNLIFTCRTSMQHFTSFSNPQQTIYSNLFSKCMFSTPILTLIEHSTPWIHICIKILLGWPSEIRWDRALRRAAAQHSWIIREVTRKWIRRRQWKQCLWALW